MKNETTEPQEHIQIKWPTLEDVAKLANNPNLDIKANKMRAFETGATRDLDTDKPDFEACLSPLVLERYAKYIRECSYLPDGTQRPDDNWQKGIPKNSYMKSLLRHVMHVWALHDGYSVEDKGKSVDIESALCAVLFNTMGYLFECVKNK